MSKIDNIWTIFSARGAKYFSEISSFVESHELQKLQKNNSTGCRQLFTHQRISLEIDDKTNTVNTAVRLMYLYLFCFGVRSHPWRQMIWVFERCHTSLRRHLSAPGNWGDWPTDDKTSHEQNCLQLRDNKEVCRVNWTLYLPHLT